MFQIQNRKPIIVSLLIIVSGLLIYVYYHHSYSISLDTNKWGAFASYLSLFVGVSNLFILIYVAINFKSNLEQPQLILKIKKEVPDFYFVKNVGRGPAINLIVIYKDDKVAKGEKGVKAVKCYSLGPEEEIKLFWMKGGKKWVVLYEDIFRNYHLISMENDVLSRENIDKKTYNRHLDKDNLINKNTETIWSVGDAK